MTFCLRPPGGPVVVIMTRFRGHPYAAGGRIFSCCGLSAFVVVMRTQGFRNDRNSLSSVLYVVLAPPGQSRLGRLVPSPLTVTIPRDEEAVSDSGRSRLFFVCPIESQT